MSLLARTKIKTKFLISPVLLTLLLVALVPVIFLNISKHYTTVSRFSSLGLTSTQGLFILFKNIKNNHYRFDRLIKNSNIAQNIQNHEQDKLKTGLDKERKRFSQNIQQYLIQFATLSQKYNLLEDHPDLVQSISRDLENYQVSLNEALKHIEDSPLLHEQLIHMDRNFIYLEKDMEELMTRVRNKTATTITDIQSEIKKEIEIFSVCLGIAIVFTIFVGLFFSTYLSRPIQNLARTIADITQKGNFSQRAQKESEDEMGMLVDGFNQMLFEMERIQTSLTQSREETQNIIESLNQILIVTNEKGLIKEANKQALLTLGYINKKDIKNKFIEHLLFEGHSESLHPVPLPHLLDDSIPNFTEKTLLDVFDQPIKVMVSSSVIKNPEKKVVGLVLLAYAV